MRRMGTYGRSVRPLRLTSAFSTSPSPALAHHIRASAHSDHKSIQYTGTRIPSSTTKHDSPPFFTMRRLLTILVTIPLFMLAAFAREQPRKSRLMYGSVIHPDGLTRRTRSR